MTIAILKKNGGMPGFLVNQYCGALLITNDILTFNEKQRTGLQVSREMHWNNLHGSILFVVIPLKKFSPGASHYSQVRTT
jgi:hypothetical protein